MTGPEVPVGSGPAAGTAPVAIISSSRQITPLKIKTLTLCDFRAFAGPEPVMIELNGKNLLVYGENGAGKSSLFHALDEFFSVSEPSAFARSQRLGALEHIFPATAKGHVFVEVELDDGKPAARWDATRHPVDTYPAKADSRIVNGAYRKAALDYRALLDTNYRHGKGAINLFDVCVRVLLRDYPAVHDGKGTRLFDLWRQLEPKPRMARMFASDKTSIAGLTLSFNQALGEAIEALVPMANAILADLGWDDVRLDALTTPGVRFVWERLRENRRYAGCEITPVLLFRGQNLPYPQSFLNEARLSALALAIYFAGRQLCAATLQNDTPRLMVLDDVLIGLDQTNRLPVLHLLDKHFSNWQIVLMTHDRVWFEMTRFYFDGRKDWKTLELFEEREPTGGSRPVLRPQDIDAVASNIATARKFHAAHEYPASAVHARVAFELSLKKVCERKAIAVRFQTDPRKLNTDDLLNAIEAWLGDASRVAMKATVDPAIVSLRMWRKVVLNPFSHWTPVSLTAGEVIGAVDAVEALHRAFKDHVK
jgi:energy-coupling factor transporter ATP-binding protein EcfA2